jgi:hypothetical protein
VFDFSTSYSCNKSGNVILRKGPACREAFTDYAVANGVLVYDPGQRIMVTGLITERDIPEPEYHSTVGGAPDGCYDITSNIFV